MSDYIIREFNKEFGQIVVEYKDSMIAIDLPINSGNVYPVGQQLEELINGMLPKGHYDRLETIAAGISNADEIAALVVPKIDPNQIDQTEQIPTI